MLSLEEIATIRSFNRKYTTVLGLLNRQVFDTTLSFTEARVLQKIAETPNISPKNIATNLGLDPSYTSRILKKLNKLDLVNIVASSVDARSKILSLTADGENQVKILDEDSNIQIEDLIADLSPAEQTELYQSFSTIEKILFNKEH
ncbi:MarR family winged helix-turn-helix transcriptional regulator [Companilactobacillus mishanensis]|uniref:MarR family winged helix-turn-helix transcriptional regulator n=1 Tax=Companilactobacillus mishanensis TaxID=2486008 RepID=UPI00129822D4|nr:MarR family transcriptional regulator [Companilactobacillus mishanensis]MQS88897.1 MarR family transcriptional regulator [Companilactobacillus mishanensis]